jgi:hypothetical protein
METTVAARMRQAAVEFLAGLDPMQRQRAALPFEPEGERTLFFYTPNDHGGLPLADMSGRQEEAAHKLLAASLSPGAHATVNFAMAVENVGAATTGFRDSAHLPLTRRRCCRPAPRATP